jgi:hypothetical protein
VKIHPNHQVTDAELLGTRNMAMSLMKSMMLASDESAYAAAYRAFGDWIRQIHNDNQYNAAGLLLYFDDEYKNKRENWSRAWRNVSSPP